MVVGRRDHVDLEREPTRTTGARSVRESAKVGLLALQDAVGNRGTRRVVQHALHVGPAGDEFEREADTVADSVMRSWETTAAHDQAVGGDDVRRSNLDRVGRAPAGPAIGLEGGALDRASEERITAAQGGGQSLPEGVRRSMEGAFGVDFSAVRVHSGGEADALNRSMQSRAFTVGADVFFAQGEYRPETTSGRKLLAHELTHTVQQGVGRRLED